MEGEENNIKVLPEAFPMNGGDGLYSYTKNSYYQRLIINSGKALIDEAIAEKLEIKHVCVNSKQFRIADLGCSVGPNTFVAMQNIIEAVKLKYQSTGLSSNIPEFLVFFNDHVSNDFNTLFTTLPPDRRYFAAGVPGSFHGRLFPEASLHFVHSSSALHWLSSVPKVVVDKNSRAWNKGKIYYASAPSEVMEAYSVQFAKDVEILHARAQELVCGGLMTVIMPGRPNGLPHSQSFTNIMFDVLGSSLMDMAKMGLLDESLVDSFNLPIYIASPQELEVLIKKNGCFSIEKMELVALDVARPDSQQVAMHFRASMEGLVSKHFGSEIMDELFNRYSKNISEPIHAFSSCQGRQMCVVLKRNL